MLEMKGVYTALVTPLAGGKTEVRLSLCVNALGDLFAVAVGQHRVARHGLVVDVYLPADTAAMAAPVRDAGKAQVICGCVKLHDL